MKKTGYIQRPNSVITQLGLHVQDSSETSISNTIPKKGIFQMIEMNSTTSINLPKLSDTKKEDKLVVFTNGACSHNGTPRARAGYAVVWPYQRNLDISKRLLGSAQTNNRAEFMALIEAQNIADTLDSTRQKPLYVYTDSELLINSITKWLPGWKNSQWKKSDNKPVLNRDLLEKIDTNNRPLIFKHVRAHTGRKDWESMYNDEADQLARKSLL